MTKFVRKQVEVDAWQFHEDSSFTKWPTLPDFISGSPFLERVERDNIIISLPDDTKVVAQDGDWIVRAGGKDGSLAVVKDKMFGIDYLYL
jgi:hypothetical protein